MTMLGECFNYNLYIAGRYGYTTYLPEERLTLEGVHRARSNKGAASAWVEQKVAEGCYCQYYLCQADDFQVVRNDHNNFEIVHLEVVLD